MDPMDLVTIDNGPAVKRFVYCPTCKDQKEVPLYGAAWSRICRCATGDHWAKLSQVDLDLMQKYGVGVADCIDNVREAQAKAKREVVTFTRPQDEKALSERQETKYNRDAGFMCRKCSGQMRSIYHGNALAGYACDKCGEEIGP